MIEKSKGSYGPDQNLDIKGLHAYLKKNAKRRSLGPIVTLKRWSYEFYTIDTLEIFNEDGEINKVFLKVHPQDDKFPKRKKSAKDVFNELESVLLNKI
ncbi:hypothetical protein GOV13_05225 [Candidatus Pacearchaeota archaeon]|nr:hypothetical protein [Candidatus Pacearchaeota archaeon]